MALLPYVPARCGHREHSENPALLAHSPAQHRCWHRSTCSAHMAMASAMALLAAAAIAFSDALGR